MISIYNKAGIGDTLIVMLDNSEPKEQSFEKIRMLFVFLKKQPIKRLAIIFSIVLDLLLLRERGK